MVKIFGVALTLLFASQFANAQTKDCKDCVPELDTTVVTQTLNQTLAWDACVKTGLYDMWRIQLFVLTRMPNQLPVFGPLKTEMVERKVDGKSLYYIYLVDVYNSREDAKVIIHALKTAHGVCDAFPIQIWRAQ